MYNIINELGVYGKGGINKFDDLFSVIRKKVFILAGAIKSRIDYGKKENTFGISLECDF